MNNPYNDNFQSGGYFFNPIRRDIAMIQGDTMSFAFQVQGLGGQTPDNIVFTCKETPDKDTALFSVDLGNHITERSYDSEHDIRTYILRIPPELTENVEAGRYFYDIQFTVNRDILTLMKGRLTVEYQITGGSVEPEPDYENGDLVKYPLVGIPLGTIKLYTEQYISDIASWINTILVDPNGRYTTQEMSGALSDINDYLLDLSAALKTALSDQSPDDIPLPEMPATMNTINGDISDINNAINAITGGSGNIPISQMPNVINNIPTVDKEPKIELAFNSNHYETETETYTVTEDGYYLVVVSSGAGNGDAVNITLPQGVQADYSNKFMLSSAWYGAVYIIVAHLTTGDTVSMTVGTNTYAVTARKTVFKLVNFPNITQLLSNSIKTDGVENNISTDITLPSSGKALIIAGCNGKELRYSFETGTECGYSFLTSGIGGRTIPYTGFLRVGYFEVDKLPYLTTSAADGGLSWLIALGEEA